MSQIGVSHAENCEWAEALPLPIRRVLYNAGQVESLESRWYGNNTQKSWWYRWAEVCNLASQVLKEDDV